MILRTNVKLNFGLNVLRKRDDGYHDIETLFVPCHEFGDTLEVITGDDYSHTSASLFARYSYLRQGCPMPTIYPDRARSAGRQGQVLPQQQQDGTIVQGISEDGKLMITIAREEGVDWDPLKDLCSKAYFLLAKDFQLPPVKIFLEKTSPVGAGLGGGSADAAFTLKALNELCGLNLPDEKLADYASRLGSDCAVFVWNRPMIGTGRGEILEPFDLDLDGYEVKVLVPEGVSVSTAEAYSGIVPKAGGSIGLKEIFQRPVEEWKDLLVNDFEETVFKAHPELAAIKQSLYDSGAVYAAMSGSGSALFGIYKK
ncbi:MAG: 4-(cytidine 5'-diphospho)-2-C-methyl-D-erythritol kinase [Bacteroidales bacterium]|nr:4-(cytidine 5'-diphospho)-2-C-methyl-D-erythritol kinase [Bacteroidales bacterium]